MSWSLKPILVQGCPEAPRASHCVTGARSTHPQDPTSFYTWYLPMSSLYTGICFHRIPWVASLMGSGSQLVVNYNPILCHRSLTSHKQVFRSIDLPMSPLYNRKYFHCNKLTALCMGSRTPWGVNSSGLDLPIRQAKREVLLYNCVCTPSLDHKRLYTPILGSCLIIICSLFRH